MTTVALLQQRFLSTLAASSAGAGPPALPGKVLVEKASAVLPMQEEPSWGTGRMLCSCQLHLQYPDFIGLIEDLEGQRLGFFYHVGAHSLGGGHVLSLSVAALTNRSLDSLQLLDSEMPEVPSEAVSGNTFQCLSCRPPAKCSPGSRCESRNRAGHCAAFGLW